MLEFHLKRQALWWNSERRYEDRMTNLRGKLLDTLLLALVVSGSSLSAAQTQNSAAGPSAHATVDLQGTLAKVERIAQSAALDLAKLRVEKWKGDSSEKQQAQANADSLQRN